jgi:hypothetical protein
MIHGERTRRRARREEGSRLVLDIMVDMVDVWLESKKIKIKNRKMW